MTNNIQKKTDNFQNWSGNITCQQKKVKTRLDDWLGSYVNSILALENV